MPVLFNSITGPKLYGVLSRLVVFVSLASLLSTWRPRIGNVARLHACTLARLHANDELTFDMAELLEDILTGRNETQDV